VSLQSTTKRSFPHDAYGHEIGYTIIKTRSFFKGFCINRDHQNVHEREMAKGNRMNKPNPFDSHHQTISMKHGRLFFDSFFFKNDSNKNRKTHKEGFKKRANQCHTQSVYIGSRTAL